MSNFISRAFATNIFDISENASMMGNIAFPSVFIETLTVHH